MKALILNSGLGHRMGVLTSEHPKCMTEISCTETILSRQLKTSSKISPKKLGFFLEKEAYIKIYSKVSNFKVYKEGFY